MKLEESGQEEGQHYETCHKRDRANMGEALGRWGRGPTQKWKCLRQKNSVSGWVSPTAFPIHHAQIPLPVNSI